MARTALAVAFLASTLLAGCAGNGPPTEAFVDAGAVGSLRVLVITDEYFPIFGAEVVLLEVALNASTNAGGDVVFEELPSQTYSVHVLRDGFLPNHTHIEVPAGERTTLRVTMRDAPRDIYLWTSTHKEGMCLVGARIDAVAPEGECVDTAYTPSSVVEFFPERDLVQAYFQIRWDPQAGATQRLRFELWPRDGETFADGAEVLVVEGTSPLEILVDEEMIGADLKQPGRRFEVRAFPTTEQDVSIEVLQPFDTYAEFLYFRPAPRLM